MTQVSLPSILPEFSQFLVRQMGLHFPPERWSDLTRGMAAAAPEFGFSGIDACMQWLLTKPLSQGQIEILACHLTIGETYFFRDPQVFDVLQNHILPALIESRRESGMHLRIWSAACSTGEEAYSIAILIRRLIPDYRQWNITILGTDINPRALRKAKSGIYSNWSFRNAQPELRASYFTPLRGGYWQIVSELRDMVTFTYLNLAEDAYPSFANNTKGMDIIFCRNVLMYFEPGLAKKVVQQHFLSLPDGGWLIVSPAEMSLAWHTQFETVNFPEAAFYRKGHFQLMRAAPAESLEPQAIIEVAKAHTDAAPVAVVRQKSAASDGIKAPAQLPASVYSQALFCYQQGRFGVAAELLERLITDQKNNTQAMNLMVRIYANQGKLTDALHWCERSIAADRVNPAGYYLMAVVSLERGQTEQAMQALKRTLYLDQHFVLGYFTLGNLYRSQSRPKEAGKCFANALSLLKDYAYDAVLPESDGMTAGRMTEIVQSITNRGSHD